jgi:hypothetical protein
VANVFIGAEIGTNLEDQMRMFYDLDLCLLNRPGGRDELTPFHLVALHYAENVGKFLYSRHGLFDRGISENRNIKSIS